MSTWKAVYINEFPPKANSPTVAFDAHRAVPGELELTGGTPVLSTNLPLGFSLSPGIALVYRLAEPLANVIGFDVAIDVALGQASLGRTFPLFSLGAGQVVASLAVIPADPGPLSGSASLELLIDGRTLELVDLELPATSGSNQLRLRFRWYTNGQLQVFVGGKLVAYEPQVLVGASLEIGTVGIGDRQARPGDVPFVADVATRFAVQLLRDDDAASALGEELDIRSSYPPPYACEAAAARLRHDLLEHGRKLMSALVRDLTVAWRDGQSGGPFSADAVAAHASSNAALEAFLRFLRHDEPEARERYLEEIEKFLRVVARTRPDDFRALFERVTGASDEMRSQCGPFLDVLRAENAAEFERLEPLRDDTRRIFDGLLEESHG